MEKSELTLQKHRIYSLDWLRIIGILAVFLHHCSKLFDYHETGLHNDVLHFLPSLHREFDGIWMMPLIFVISGASVFFSLKSRSAGGFIKERILRIAVPLILLGTFIINPPQVYVVKSAHGDFAGNFFQWYSHLFEGFWPTGNFVPLGIGTHLWYLMTLFLFSLFFLPLFLRGKRSGVSILERISRFFINPRALFLLFIPIALSSAACEAMGLGMTRVAGHWDQVSYIFFFCYGYMIYSNPEIGKTIHKYGLLFLIVAAILTILYLDIHFGIHWQVPGMTEHDFLLGKISLPPRPSLRIVTFGLRGLISWCWILGLLGAGQRLLEFSNRFLVYANEAVLPFYILHQTVIFCLGYYILPWQGNDVLKYFLIALSSFFIIMFIYELLIRRIRFLRMLFGLKINNFTPRQQLWLYIVTMVVFSGTIALIFIV